MDSCELRSSRSVLLHYVLVRPTLGASPNRALHDVRGDGDGTADGSRAALTAAFGVPRRAPIAFVPARASRCLGARGDSAPAASGASFVGDDGVPFFALRRRPRVELRANPEAIAAAAASPDAVLLPRPARRCGSFPTTTTRDRDRNANRTSGGAPRRRRCASRRTRSTRRAELPGVQGARRRARVLRGRHPGAMDAAVRSAVLRREKGAGVRRRGRRRNGGPEMRRADAGCSPPPRAWRGGSARCASAPGAARARCW